MNYHITLKKIAGIKTPAFLFAIFTSPIMQSNFIFILKGGNENEES